MQGVRVGSQCMAICRTGSQCRGCNSTSSLVSMFGALVMKNRVVGSQTRAIWSQHGAICRAESQRRAIYRAESKRRARGRM